MKMKLFIYGSLMSGMNNHHYLETSFCMGNTEIDGYDMYLSDYYPLIVPGKGKIKGEVYEIDNKTLENIDYLENEGTLYLRKEIDTKFGKTYIYVFNQKIDKETPIPYEMQPYNELIYYVSYGSNILEERFKCYIKGGICKFNNKKYSPCTNKHMPIKSKNIMIPYKMYFSNSSANWNGSSVCFLDYSKKDYSYGKAYLITKDQFFEIQKKEGITRYGRIIQLEDIEGYKAYTFTNENILEYKQIDSIKEEYLNVVKKGLKESFNLTEQEVMDYIKECCKKIS